MRRKLGLKIQLAVTIVKQLGRSTAREVCNEAMIYSSTTYANTIRDLNKAVGYGLLNKNDKWYSVAQECDMLLDEEGFYDDAKIEIKNTHAFPKQDPHPLSQVWR